MRILIGYDGSKHSDEALEDLKLAGLPREARGLVVSVADALSSASSVQEAALAMPSRQVATSFNSYETVKRAEELASAGADRLGSYFPEWEISTRVTSGPAAWELIEAANDWNPDLLVVGSEGQSATGRILFGSVSKRVVTEANHSVRVGRSVERKKQDAPPKIIVGIDGSPAAREAVHAVGRRAWPEGTQIRLVVAHAEPLALDGLTPRQPVSAITDPNEAAALRAEAMLGWARDQLKSVSSNVSVSIQGGDPKRVLLREARKWRADSIVVGTRDFGGSGFERFRLGSVSTAVVMNAPCSVEVVRETE